MTKERPGRKSAAWRISLDTLATVKALAVVMNVPQADVVSAALDAYLPGAIRKSGKGKIIKVLASSYAE